MARIKILGGGISGLTAAIHLQKGGLDVEVHEAKSFFGKHTNDFQYLENWTHTEDTMEILKKINIRTDFYHKACFKIEMVSPSLSSYVGTSSVPIMYLIKRGHEEDTIDSSLERQAGEEGVELLYQSKLEPSDADIIATGIKEPTFIAMGTKFKCIHPDRVIVLFDNNLSLNMYSYLIVHNQWGEIVCVNPAGINDHEGRLQKTINRFKEISHVSMREPFWRFSAPGSFNYMNQACVDNRLFIGEAAGFQDNLAGFGMIYAFKSGYYAAKSLLEGRDYDALWKADFLRSMSVSRRNRALYEKLSNKGYDRCISLMNRNNLIIRFVLDGRDIRKTLKRIYNHSFPSLLRPFIRYDL